MTWRFRYICSPPSPGHRSIHLPPPCGVAPARQRYCPAASVSVGAPSDRPPAPPRRRTTTPRHARPRREARAAHAALPRWPPRRRRVLRRRGARGDEDARPQLRDALDEPDGPAGVPQGHRGHHLRPLWRRVEADPQGLHRRAAQRPARPVLQVGPRGGGRPPPPRRGGGGGGGGPPAARAVNLSELITVYAADSAVRTIIGSSFKDRDAFLKLLERMVKMVAKMSLPDLYPSSRLAMLISRMPGQMKRQRQELVAFIDNIVREHEENKAAGNDGKEDLLDVLLRFQTEGDLQVPITTDNIKSVVGDMLGTGSETVATVLQWILAELMRNPRVMTKVQDEVRRTLAGQRKVTEVHISNLHYMHLVIKKTMRLHLPTPLLLRRECRSACQVLGFGVPKDAMVLVNAWAISRDPRYWDMPRSGEVRAFQDRFQGSRLRVHAVRGRASDVPGHRVRVREHGAHTG
ncbi:premnaspirodiene oxygenase-like [Panicum miliaceum]|uniref:Premnaspirodiene oxygenase-like n=1 Tax=Panicum miliaceum TaxID=4540 RepID=A0A3L6S3L2_PANMI|nr:premnaspirodiene oxygenase-like [Panicum miliaceum]